MEARITPEQLVPGLDRGLELPLPIPRRAHAVHRAPQLI